MPWSRSTSPIDTPPATRRWVLPAVVYAGILVVSSIGGERLDAAGLPDWVAYLGHAVEYGVLGAALRWAAGGLRRPVLVTVVLGAAAGALDEAWQSTVPGRDPSLVDLGVDVVAVTTVAVLLGRWAAGR